MDIDIDCSGDFEPEKIFPNAVRASMIQKDKLLKHNAGIYFQKIPKDSITGFSAIPYKEAEDLGYMKIDFLHLPSVLDYFDSKQDIRTLMHKEPDWKLLRKESVVKKLFQLGRSFWLVSQIKPTSIEELADCTALIRPGKSTLVKKYLQDKDKVRKVLYMEPSDGGYYFKRSHSIAYSYNIVLQLHLIKSGIL
jgi:DNA polymerase III alpha subunit